MNNIYKFKSKDVKKGDIVQQHHPEQIQKKYDKDIYEEMYDTANSLMRHMKMILANKGGGEQW